MFGLIKKWWLNRKRRAFERRMISHGAMGLVVADSDALRFWPRENVSIAAFDGRGPVLGRVIGVERCYPSDGEGAVWVRISDHAK